MISRWAAGLQPISAYRLYENSSAKIWGDGFGRGLDGVIQDTFHQHEYTGSMR